MPALGHGTSDVGRVGYRAGMIEPSRFQPSPPRPWPRYRIWQGRAVPTGYEYIGDVSGGIEPRAWDDL